MRTAFSTVASLRGRSPMHAMARAAKLAVARREVGFEQFRGRPEAFQREVLGYDPVEPQVRVFDAYQAHDLVAVPSGRAMGKSRLDAGTALHFAATEGPNALVVLLAPTFRQIQVILWEELRLLYFGAKIPLGGDCAKLVNTGLRFADGSRIFGVTGDKPEALQGIRAPRMLVICDEASGIPDTTFTALEGNLAGGGKMLLTGNPTRSTGFFREACRAESRFTVVPLPSTASPNVVAGEVVVPGLATSDFVEERRQEWGEDSPLFKIHVLGQFVELEEGQLFSADMIAAAEARWKDTPATGRLVIGVDPAGQSGDGDESAFACRRGKKVVRLRARRGLTPDGHVTEVLGLAKDLIGDGLRDPANRPLVVVDRDGWIGALVYAALAAYRSKHEEAFDLRGVRGGERAKRMPLQIDRVRDETWLALVDAMRDGLAFPTDVKLARELAAVRLERHVSGRSKVTGKDDLRRELGRSPDRADALTLCVSVEPGAVEPATTAHEPTGSNLYDVDPEHALDPYAGADAWR